MTDKVSLKNKDIKNESYIKRLCFLGYTESEAKIYITLLEFGKELGGTKIALLTKLHRQYVYLSLPRLIKDSLIEEVKFGKQSKYKARGVHVLEAIGRKQSILASDLAKDLHTISNIGNDQDFEIIQGQKAIQIHEIEGVMRAGEDWECYIIGGGSIGYANVMGDALDEHLEEMQKKQLSIKYIGSKSEIPMYKNYIGKFKNQEYRFMEKLPTGVTHLVVRQDSVSFYSFLTPPLVYVVKSKQVADNYKAFFMMLWEMAKE